MVFGFQLSVARVGSTVNFVLMEPLFNYIGQFHDGATTVGWSLLIAGLSCVMSFLCAVLLAWMDKRRSRLLGIQEIGESGEVVKISDVKDFPISFWFLTLACLAYYGAIFPFVSLAQDFFKTKFDFTSQEANKIIGLIYLISAPVSPLLGLLLDKVGKNITMVFLAVLASGGCHCLLAFTQVHNLIMIIIVKHPLHVCPGVSLPRHDRDGGGLQPARLRAVADRRAADPRVPAGDRVRADAGHPEPGHGAHHHGRRHHRRRVRLRLARGEFTCRENVRGLA